MHSHLHFNNNTSAIAHCMHAHEGRLNRWGERKKLKDNRGISEKELLCRGSAVGDSDF